jgi:hypothetical protein
MSATLKCPENFLGDSQVSNCTVHRGEKWSQPSHWAHAHLAARADVVVHQCFDRSLGARYRLVRSSITLRVNQQLSYWHSLPLRSHDQTLSQLVLH